MFPDPRFANQMPENALLMLGEAWLNPCFHLIYVSVLFALFLFRRHQIKFGIAYRMAVVFLGFGWLLPVFVQWVLISIESTFDNRNRMNLREFSSTVPWAHVIATLFKGMSLLLFVISLNFDRPPHLPSHDDNRTSPGPNLGIDE